MPCYDPQTREEEEDERHMKQGGALLCELMRKIEDAGGLAFLPSKMLLWWSEHKQRDERKAKRGY